MQKLHRLGLDMGTNSIGGWGVTLDAQGQPSDSLACFVRIFSDGRNPKDGSSLAVQRRVPRGMRRRRDRYLRRRDDLMEMLITVGLMPPDETERQCLASLDPYALRAHAVRRPITPYELGRALFHLGQRRGFKSNRKTDTSDSHKLTEKINELRRLIRESKAETLGEFLHKRRLKGRMVRARPEAGFYPDRALYEEEFDKIRAAQAAHQALQPGQWDELRQIIFRQRKLKPVDPGWCLLEDGARRAHRALPCAQEFRMVQEANNLRVLIRGKRAEELTREQRDIVLRELRGRKELDLDRLVTLLKLPEGAQINLLDENRKTLKGDETATRLAHKDLFGARWRKPPFGYPRRTSIVRKLIETEDPHEIELIAQSEWGLDEAAAKKLAATPLPEGYARLSEQAIGKLLPIMEEQGLGYADAVAEVTEYRHHSDFRPDAALDRLPYYGAVLTRHVVGADPTKPKEDEVGHYGRIGNPTVHIGLNQLRRVVNRWIEIYGKPEEIVIELARELKMNKEDRDAERKKNTDNETANRRREEQIRSAGGHPSSHLLRKLRLWEEQSQGSVQVCPFTGKTISFEMAMTDATEIEHILPFSKTLDDSMANKVLCLREANRVKRDRSPFDAFQSNPQAGEHRCAYDEILDRAHALPPNKRWRFLPDAMERFADETDFLDRQLNETKYLSRIARVYLAHLYNEKAEGRLRVRAIPGKLTAMLRGKWGLSKLLRDHNRIGDTEGGSVRKNRDDHRHHALDAFVIAMTDQRMLKRISDLNSDGDRKRLIEAVPEPWDGFAPDALRPKLDHLVISHKPDHGTPGERGKTTGALHNDTAYGLVTPGKNGTWVVVSRGALAGMLTPKDMDAALPAIRDKTLREALIASWKEFKTGSRIAGENDAGPSRKKKNPAGLFAEHLATTGIVVGGRNVRVRRVRMTEELTVVPIKDRKTGKPYKAYKPDGNAFADIYRLPDGRWTATVIRRFDANQRGFDPAKRRPHPAAKKIMRLHIDDMVALDDGGRRRILRVVKMSGQTITLADHHEGGALKKRNDDKEDPFKYLEKSANSLKELHLRKVGVDEIGRLSDPGPRTAPKTS